MEQRGGEFHSEYVSGEGNLVQPLRDESKNQDHTLVIARVASSYRRYDGEEGTIFKNIRVSGFQAIHLWDSIMTVTEWKSETTFSHGPRLMYVNAKLEMARDNRNEMAVQLVVDSGFSSIGLSARYNSVKPVVKAIDSTEQDEPDLKKRRKPHHVTEPTQAELDLDATTEHDREDEPERKPRRRRRRAPERKEPETTEQFEPDTPFIPTEPPPPPGRKRENRKQGKVELRGEPELTSLED